MPTHCGSLSGIKIFIVNKILLVWFDRFRASNLIVVVQSSWGSTRLQLICGLLAVFLVRNCFDSNFLDCEIRALLIGEKIEMVYLYVVQRHGENVSLVSWGFWVSAASPHFLGTFCLFMVFCLWIISSFVYCWVKLWCFLISPINCILFVTIMISCHQDISKTIFLNNI